MAGAQTKIPELPPECRCRHSATSSKLVTGLRVRITPTGLPGAVDDPVLPGPGIGIAVDVGEVVFAQLVPARARAVEKGPGRRSRVIDLAQCERGQDQERAGEPQQGATRNIGLHRGYSRFSNPVRADHILT